MSPLCGGSVGSMPFCICAAIDMSRSMETFCFVVLRRSRIYCFRACCILTKLSLSCLMSVCWRISGSVTSKFPCDISSVAMAISSSGCRYHLSVRMMARAMSMKSMVSMRYVKATMMSVILLRSSSGTVTYIFHPVRSISLLDVAPLSVILKSTPSLTGLFMMFIFSTASVSAALVSLALSGWYMYAPSFDTTLMVVRSELRSLVTMSFSQLSGMSAHSTPYVFPLCVWRGVMNVTHVLPALLRYGSVHVLSWCSQTYFRRLSIFGFMLRNAAMYTLSRLAMARTLSHSCLLFVVVRRFVCDDRAPALTAFSMRRRWASTAWATMVVIVMQRLLLFTMFTTYIMLLAKPHPKMPSVMNSVMFMRNDNDDINLLKRNIWVSPPSFLVLVWLAVCMACEGRGMPWLVVAKLIFSFHIPKRSLVFFQPT